MTFSAPQLLLAASMPAWLDPLWKFSLGVTAAMVLFSLVYAMALLVLPKFAGVLEEVALEGYARPLFYLSLVPVALTVVAFAWAPYEELFEQLRDPQMWTAFGAALKQSGQRLIPPSGPFLLVLGAATTLIFFTGCLIIRAAAPKVYAIASTTSSEGIAQPLFWVSIFFGLFLLQLFIWLPYNTFGDDIKMLKDSGLTLIMVLSLMLALWNSSVSIAADIDGRTALTLLSKPLGRREFILGKFMGVLGPVLVLFAVLAFFFLGCVAFKVAFDSGKTMDVATAVECEHEVAIIAPGLALTLMEAVVLAAISVAISTRLPMLANLVICFSIYVLGHLVPLLVQSSVGKLEIVQFVGRFLAAILPVLDHFNIQAAVAAGAPVPTIYLGWALLYCLLYSTFALLGALILFEDRDLA